MREFPGEEQQGIGHRRIENHGDRKYDARDYAVEKKGISMPPFRKQLEKIPQKAFPSAHCIVVLFGPVLLDVRNKREQIVYKQTDSDGEKNDSEEFAENEYERSREHFLRPQSHFEDYIHPNHVRSHSGDDVYHRELGAERKQCGESRSPRQQGKDHGNQRGGVRSVRRIVKKVHIQQHFQGNEKENDGTAYGKRLDVHAEKAQKPFPAEEKGDEQRHGDPCGTPHVDFSPLMAQINDDGG